MNTVDIIDLVENSPLTKFSQYTHYKSKIIDKLKAWFTTTEQQLFLANFYLYLNYSNTTDFVIPLDNVWKWLGFGRINDAKRVIDKNFKENIDYKIYGNETNVFALQVGKAKNDEINKDDKTNVFAPPVGGAKNDEINGINNTEVFLQSQENSISNNNDKTNTFAPAIAGAAFSSETRGGHNKEYIYMTVNCFKKLCLKARTDKADQIHDYYIKLEDLLNELLEEQSKELCQKLTSVASDSQQTLINCYKDKQVVYFIQIEENIIKFGYTKDIDTRLRQHKKTFGSDIMIKLIYESLHNREFESLIKEKLSKNIISKIYKHKGEDTKFTELIQLTDNFTYDHLVRYVDKIKKEIDQEYLIPIMIKENSDLKVKIAQLEEIVENTIIEKNKNEYDNNLKEENGNLREEVIDLKLELKRKELDRFIPKHYKEHRITNGIEEKFCFGPLCYKKATAGEQGMWLPITNFGKCTNAKDGLRNECRQCRSVHERSYSNKMTEEELEKSNIERALKLRTKIIDGKKKCSSCGEIKDISNFYKNGKYKDGTIKYYSHCLNCTKIKRS
jgi:predicted GIY-YIG superfamily endonuclease